MATWKTLKSRRDRAKSRSILSLFDDPNRFEAFSASCGDLLLDYSKTNIDDKTQADLLNLAKSAHIESYRDAMFAGAKINETEKRAVLHTALRNLSGNPIAVDGKNVMPDIYATLDRMAAFSDGLRSGAISTANGETFTDVVNIGIGGSDLGPVMTNIALSPYADGPSVHFVSNLDGADIADTLKPLNPAKTRLPNAIFILFPTH